MHIEEDEASNSCLDASLRSAKHRTGAPFSLSNAVNMAAEENHDAPIMGADS